MARKESTPDRQHPIPMQRPVADVPADEICRLYLGGMSEKALSTRFGVARSAIRPRLLSGGIVPRNRSKAMYLRMEQTSADQRKQLASAAHDALRGTSPSLASMCARARTKERKMSHATNEELMIAKWLIDRRLDVVPQKAVGPYNLDLAVNGSVAVELHLGGWHLCKRHRLREPKRVKYLLDLGWSVLTIWTSPAPNPKKNGWTRGPGHPLTEAVSEYILTYVNELSRHEPPWREYRVIWGDGKPCPSRRLDID